MDERIYTAATRLERWLNTHEYKAYDPFEGLNSHLYPLTFRKKLFRQILVQAVKRFPWNLRPLLGIKPSRSSKGLAYIAKGYLWLYRATGGKSYAEKSRYCLDWLTQNANQNYSGLCWGNHFDYQTRGYFLRAGEPTIVWSSLVAQAFVMAYVVLGDRRYLEIAGSTADFILKDLTHATVRNGVCISYIPGDVVLIHNSNLLGAALLAKVYKYTGREDCRAAARRAIVYACEHQLPNGAWYYGEEDKFHWVDNFHSGYNLDAIKDYGEYSGDKSFSSYLNKGYSFYRTHFFMHEGIPKFYQNEVYPIDIQCVSQSIETLLYFREVDLALDVARWAIHNMQDHSGYFYYQKHRLFVNKTPMLHWGQGTMFSALSRLCCVMEETG